MIHFDGFDVTKEIIYSGAADEYRRRGISLLIVDHPGVEPDELAAGYVLTCQSHPTTPSVAVDYDA